MEHFIKTLVYSGLTLEQAHKLAAVFTESSLEKNAFLLREKTICRHLAFISNGMCRYYFTSSDGNEVTRWVALEHEFVLSFGSFIHQTPTLENIQAIKPTNILVAKKADFDALYQSEPFVREFWTQSIQKYLVDIEARVYSLIALSAQKRYENLMAQFPKLVSEVPDKYLASILGIKPRHLTRLRAGNK